MNYTDKFKPGDRVIYFDVHAPINESGTVSSTNDKYVFVVFDGEKQSKACHPDTLKPVIAGRGVAQMNVTRVRAELGRSRSHKKRVLAIHPNAVCNYDGGLFSISLEKYDTPIPGGLSAKGAWTRAWEYCEREAEEGTQK